MLYREVKQDSVIILANLTKKWLKHLEHLEPTMFRTDRPIFMPKEYSKTVELKLDSNIVFFEIQANGTINLVDEFAVNGGPTIDFQLGTWDMANGMRLEKTLNRWDRRTDLYGATFVNTLAPNDDFADFVRDENNTIIGSKGWLQDKLKYVIEQLNLTVKTTESTLPVEGGGNQHVVCWYLLFFGHSDICSEGWVHDNDNDLNFALPIATERTPKTLLAGTPKGTAPDAWVYIEIFGLPQWLTFFSILLVIAIAWSGIQRISGHERQSGQRGTAYEGFLMASLYCIQQGSHPGNMDLVAKRLLALTTSAITLIVWIYYSNDITSKMTAGSPPIPVKTFDDVLDQGYKVIVIGGAYADLATSKKGTAKHSVFKLFFEEDAKKIEKYLNAIHREKKTHEQFIEEGGEEPPHWYTDGSSLKNFHWAAEQIINNPKTLWYCTGSCALQPIKEGKVVELKMEDSYTVYAGFVLQPNSEYLSLFNHYLLKAYETGILKRLERSWFAEFDPPIKIGIPEPGPLEMNNVMSLFFFLLGSVITACVIAAVERVVNRFKSRAAERRIFVERKRNGGEEQRMGREREDVGERVKGKKTGREIELTEMEEEEIINADVEQRVGRERKDLGGRVKGRRRGREIEEKSENNEKEVEEITRVE